MDELARNLENALWASCPIREWDFRCKRDICTCCDRPVMIVIILMNGYPMKEPLGKPFYLSDIEKQEGRLEEFCREEINTIITNIEKATGMTIDDVVHCKERDTHEPGEADGGE